MNFFNIGGTELLLVMIIMLIFLGPERMKSGSRSLARMITKIVRSEAWHEFFGLYKEIKQYPSQLMKEAQLDEINRELRDLQTKANQEINQITGELQPKKLDFSQDFREMLQPPTTAPEKEDAQPHDTTKENEP